MSNVCTTELNGLDFIHECLFFFSRNNCHKLFPIRIAPNQKQTSAIMIHTAIIAVFKAIENDKKGIIIATIHNRQATKTNDQPILFFIRLTDETPHIENLYMYSLASYTSYERHPLHLQLK